MAQALGAIMSAMQGVGGAMGAAMQGVGSVAQAAGPAMADTVGQIQNFGQAVGPALSGAANLLPPAGTASPAQSGLLSRLGSSLGAGLETFGENLGTQLKNQFAKTVTGEGEEGGEQKKQPQQRQRLPWNPPAYNPPGAANVSPISGAVPTASWGQGMQQSAPSAAPQQNPYAFMDQNVLATLMQIIGGGRGQQGG